VYRYRIYLYLMNLNPRKVLIIGVLLAFLANTFGPVPLAQAQDFRLPAPGAMVHLSPEFNPPILKGIKVHPDNPFRFDFILDKGDSQLGNDQLKDESSKLIKYFLASLTIPEKDLWVNLSPYEKDRIIPNSFGLTEMGRDLLAEDYMLKQITASLIYPEDEIGKKFWKRIYEESAKKFGTTDIPVNTFNKVWIVPEKAVVYENAKAGTAYVVESKLKVMLEQDYLAFSHNVIPAPTGALGQAKAGIQNKNDINALGSQIVREIVIPELTKEVNEGKNFAQLRQVYNSLILATWYKKKIKDSILEQVYADKNKVAGVNIDDPQEKEKIYERYLQAFKKGVYNYIKEEIDPATQEALPRKYFSGGIEATDLSDMAMKVVDNPGRLPNQALEAQVDIRPVGFEGISQGPQPKENRYRDPFFILTTPYGKSLAAQWIQTYANENRTEGKGDIDRILDFLSDPHHRTGDFIGDMLQKFPILEDMHRRFAQATQPSKTVQAFDLPSARGKTELIGALINGPNLLDVGAGMAIFSERCLHIYPKILHAISVDIESQRKIPFQIPTGKTHEFKLAIDHSIIPVEDRWANTAVATFFLHHLVVDRLNYLKEIKRTIVPGGRFIVLETTFSDVIQEDPIDKNDLRAKQMSRIFRSLKSDKEKLSFLHFADWFIYNFVNRSRDPLVFGNYETMEAWKDIFEKAGFIVEQERNLGFSALGSRNPESRGLFILRNPSNDKQDRAMNTQEEKTDLQEGTVERFLFDQLRKVKGGNLVFGPKDFVGVGHHLDRLTLEVLKRAMEVVEFEHKGQKRKDALWDLNLKGTDYYVHILGVVGVLVNDLQIDDDPYVILAAFFHDVLEDSIQYYAAMERLTQEDIGLMTKEQARRLRERYRGKVLITDALRSQAEASVRKKMKTVGLSGDEMDRVFFYVHAMTKKTDDLMGEYYPGLIERGYRAMSLKLADRIFNLRSGRFATNKTFAKRYIEETIAEFFTVPMGRQQKSFISYLSNNEDGDRVKNRFRAQMLKTILENLNLFPDLQTAQDARKFIRPIAGTAYLGYPSLKTAQEVVRYAMYLFDNPYNGSWNTVATGFEDDDYSYDNLISKRIETLIQKGQKPKVLVIGAGGGRVIFDLKESFPQAEVVFINKQPIRTDPEVFRKARYLVQKKLSIQEAKDFLDWFNRNEVVYNVEHGLPFKDKEFDVVFFTSETLTYVKDKDKLLADIKRVLNERGIGFVNPYSRIRFFNAQGHEFLESKDLETHFNQGTKEPQYIIRKHSLIIINRYPNIPFPKLKLIRHTSFVRSKDVIGLPTRYISEYKIVPEALDHGIHQSAGFQKDNAQTVMKIRQFRQEKGGIDLTPANMNLQTQNSNGEIKFHLDSARLAQLQNAPGFVPVIINIQPMNNLREFLGLNDSPTFKAG